MVGICRWHVHGGTEWVDWIGGGNALWYDSCSICVDQQRNGCHGKFYWLIDALFVLYCPGDWCCYWCRWNFCSLTNTRAMILVDAQEFTALDSPAFQLVNRTFLGQVLWKYTALGVKIFTIHVPSIKAVSLYLLLYPFFVGEFELMLCFWNFIIFSGLSFHLCLSFFHESDHSSLWGLYFLVLVYLEIHFLLN